MINDDTTFVPIKKFISKEDCLTIIKSSITEGRFDYATVGVDNDKKMDTSIRKTELYFHKNTEFENDIMETVQNVNKKHWNFEIDKIEVLQMGVYNEGCFYGWHQDNFSIASGAPPRKLSFSLLLNSGDEFSGGELEIETLKGSLQFSSATNDNPFTSFKIKSPKVPGTLIVFPSYVRHRVLPVTRGVRYSLVGWVLGKNNFR